LDEFNALLLAVNQEPNHPNVDQGDFSQIQNFMCAAITHCGSNAGDKVRLNSADQPQSRHTSIAVSLNPQHFSFSPLGADDGADCANFSGLAVDRSKRVHLPILSCIES
jgi:hypothetical protein